ncbi:F-box protein [Hibiscus syriacus]|uniref:F-box protein n=1 Tax=Hibiscus syriacus TaxID=106335 RepID=A0A6A2Z3S8_HIBSY|nr:F-box protein [Hibiscus syriacus]
MVASLLPKGIPLLRLRLQRYNLLAAGILSPLRRPWCAAAESAVDDEENISSANKTDAVPSPRDLLKYHTQDDPGYKKWKDKKEEILRDIQPIISLAREILHSNRYMDGEQLTVADEKVLVERLLRYHPKSEDKIGCGLDSIMVDRHPEFRHSRCICC